MADKFGAPSTAIRDISKRFGDVDLDGYTLEISQGGLYLTVDVLDVPTKEGGRVLILQDSPPENTARSPEAVKATDLLAKSFKVTLDEK
jgi:hypothetical protein